MSVYPRLLLLLIVTGFFFPNPSATKEHEEVGAESALAEHMQLHFTAIKAIKIFVISGQLDGVYEPADWLQEHEARSDLPSNWAPYVEEMRRYAGEVKSARHLVFASAALAQMARVCGECHAANNAEINSPEVEFPLPTGDSVQAQMRRHLWATDREDSPWRVRLIK